MYPPHHGVQATTVEWEEIAFAPPHVLNPGRVNWGPHSKIDLHSCLENIEVSFGLSLGNMSKAVLKAPFYVGVQISVDAAHQHRQAATVDVGAVEVDD